MTGSHGYIDAKTGDRRVGWAIVVNLVLTVVQIAGGILSGSLALIADAIHNLSDALSLVAAYVARRIARLPSTEYMTFGYGRAELIAALINYTVLILIGLYLLYEAGVRFFMPDAIDGWIVVIIAGAALLVDAVTVILTYTLSRQSLNIKAAFMHNLADALASIGVIVAGTLIILYQWYWVDPLVTLMIAAYILWQAFVHIGPVIRILMLGTPHHIELGDVKDALASLDRVMEVHHVHLWQPDETRIFLEAHLVIADDDMGKAHAVIHQAGRLVMEKFRIGHTTFQVESAGEFCPDNEKPVHCP